MTIRAKKYVHKSPKLTLVLAAMVVVLLAVQIVVSNRLSTEGQTLTSLEEKIGAISLENKRLRTQKAEMASLLEVSEKAEEQGYIDNPQVLILQPDQAVALITAP